MTTNRLNSADLSELVSNTPQENQPIEQNEDVEFSTENADTEDLEAQERARQANLRQTGKKGL